MKSYCRNSVLDEFCWKTLLKRWQFRSQNNINGSQMRSEVKTAPNTGIYAIGGLTSKLFQLKPKAGISSGLDLILRQITVISNSQTLTALPTGRT